MNAFFEKLLGKDDPTVQLVQTELAYAKSVESFCFERLSFEKNKAERLYLRNGLGRVASLRQQAKTIRRQIRSWGVLSRFYDEKTFATVGLRNVETVEKFLADSSVLRWRFRTVVPGAFLRSEGTDFSRR
jgi:hypothetical protein